MQIRNWQAIKGVHYRGHHRRKGGLHEYKRITALLAKTTLNQLSLITRTLMTATHTQWPHTHNARASQENQQTIKLYKCGGYKSNNDSYYSLHKRHAVPTLLMGIVEAHGTLLSTLLDLIIGLNSREVREVQQSGCPCISHDIERRTQRQHDSPGCLSCHVADTAVPACPVTNSS